MTVAWRRKMAFWHRYYTISVVLAKATMALAMISFVEAVETVEMAIAETVIVTLAVIVTVRGLPATRATDTLEIIATVTDMTDTRPHPRSSKRGRKLHEAVRSSSGNLGEAYGSLQGETVLPDARMARSFMCLDTEYHRGFERFSDMC